MKKKRISKSPEKRRAEILTAARELLDLHGIDNTRVSDIVNKVGVAQGVFYYYFRSKDEMIDAILKEVEEETAQEIRRIRSEATPLLKKLSDVLLLYLDFIDQFTSDDKRLIPNYHKLLEDGISFQKIRRILITAFEDLVKEGTNTGQLLTKYPVLTVHVLEYGLTSAASKKRISGLEIYTIVEQALGITTGELSNYYQLQKGGIVS